MPADSFENSSDLPWGWWLRATRSGFEDAAGRTWQSVRDAFWEGHLGFPKSSHAPEQLELLLRMLAAIDQRAGNSRCNNIEFFCEHWMFWRFYMSWLFSVGLTIPDHQRFPIEAWLTKQGRAVMLMLQATREPEWINLPIQAVIDAVKQASEGPEIEVRENALRAFERQVGYRRYVFTREIVAKNHIVALTGMVVHARMPTRRVLWSQSFTETDPRDRLFAWLAGHVDRWDDWGELAYSKGASALTQRFLRHFIEME